MQPNRLFYNFFLSSQFVMAVLCCLFFTFSVQAGTLNSVNITTVKKEIEIQFNFNSETRYNYFYLTNPQRIVIDFHHSQALANLLPISINNGVVEKIRQSKPLQASALRIVIDVPKKTEAKFRKNKNNIILVLPNPKGIALQASYQANPNRNAVNTSVSSSKTASAPIWVIAIDPGHGGKDPGAIGRTLKLYEKVVTLSIARELKALLDRDPNFRAVLTRNGDYFISVPQRSEIARKNKANYLISIHADSSVSSALRGASVWVLSNRRANSEMGRWLEDHEKQSELLGGVAEVLSGNEKYLNQTVLDLQFGHSQRAGYELGDIILKRFAKITKLSRQKPQHASLGVLRSPDIPSILVETGFVSNRDEEQKLSSLNYRRQVARIIYDGLVEFRRRNIGKETNMITTITRTQPPISSPAASSTKKAAVVDSDRRHSVKSGETLNGIARRYGVTANGIIELNQLKVRELLIGQKLKIPLGGSVKEAKENKETKKTATKPNSQTKYHIVKKGQTLSAISREHNIALDTLLKLNNLKDGHVRAGQKIRLN